MLSCSLEGPNSRACHFTLDKVRLVKLKIIPIGTIAMKESFRTVLLTAHLFDGRQSFSLSVWSFNVAECIMLVTLFGGQAPMPQKAPAFHRVLTVTFGGSVAALGCLQLDVLGARQDLLTRTSWTLTHFVVSRPYTTFATSSHVVSCPWPWQSISLRLSVHSTVFAPQVDVGKVGVCARPRLLHPSQLLDRVGLSWLYYRSSRHHWPN